ncbi:two-component system sensor histidine kinase YesM [Paenibacillus castaneae]|uniref:sensor histidine kinase n=1 Tax=Paenibacillus castaneae TaxID=474957 RepID=UPI00141AA2FE|nr:sensor histidine kinase [Paenibacillus castaneae]NIK76609.1 two-component system sensor histidine kinase YesM [Paenibacillus castaneae]
MLKMKALYTNLRIKHKMFVLISIIMLVIALLGVIVQQYIFDFYDREIYEQSSKALSLSSLSIENELMKMEKLSFMIATDSTIQHYLRSIKSGLSDYDNYVVQLTVRERMVNIGALDKYVLSTQLYDVNNNEYAVGANSVTVNQGRLNEYKLLTSVNKGGNSWIAPDTTDNSLIAAREVRSFEKLNLDYIGTLAIRIDMKKLFSDFAKGMNSNDAKLIIMKNKQSVYPEASEFPIDRLAELKGDEGYKIIRSEGKQYFVTFMASPKMEWTYYTLIPFDEIFQRIEKVKKTILIIFIVLFVSILLITVSFANGITEPIERLNSKMKRVQLGHFEYIEEPNERALAMDEVGQMHRNFRIMVERINELIHENYVKQLTIRDTEFKALQAQINPHFLYNTLESINWTAKLSNQTRISQMVEALGSLLRTSINLKEPLIPLGKELDIISHYVTIQKFRFDERLDFQLDVPDKVLFCSIPKLSLQPLVENAINYGLEQMIDTCTIKIHSYIKDDLLFVSVEDNGPGMEQQMVVQLLNGEVKTKGSGLGLKNIEDRIKLLYGEAYGLMVESEPNKGTKVTLMLPYEMRDIHV